MCSKMRQMQSVDPSGPRGPLSRPQPPQQDHLSATRNWCALKVGLARLCTVRGKRCSAAIAPAREPSAAAKTQQASVKSWGCCFALRGQRQEAKRGWHSVALPPARTQACSRSPAASPAALPRLQGPYLLAFLTLSHYCKLGLTSLTFARIVIYFFKLFFAIT